jgi:hypothetical protein
MTVNTEASFHDAEQLNTISTRLVMITLSIQ